MKQFIDKNMKWILIILLVISLIITSHYIFKSYNSSHKMSYTLYKETICKIDDCHQDTGLCDVAPPSEVPQEEKDCKSNYDKYTSNLDKEYKENIKLLSSSSISFFLFLILTIIYVINDKNKKRV